MCSSVSLSADCVNKTNAVLDKSETEITAWSNLSHDEIRKQVHHNTNLIVLRNWFLVDINSFMKNLDQFMISNKIQQSIQISISRFGADIIFEANIRVPVNLLSLLVLPVWLADFSSIESTALNTVDSFLINITILIMSHKQLNWKLHILNICALQDWPMKSYFLCFLPKEIEYIWVWL